MKKEVKLVLVYHGFDTKDNYSISTKNFEEQILFLISKGFKFVNLENLSKEPGKVVCLTFDDGYESQYAAYKILKRYNLPGTLFAVYSFINKPGYLSSAQLKEMHKNNMLIGSHTFDHENLTKVNDKVLKFELKESKKQLEKMLHFKITSFSFPGGKYSKKIIKKCFEYGYKHLRTSDIFHVSGINYKGGEIFPGISVHKSFQNLNLITNERFVNFIRCIYWPIQCLRQGTNNGSK